VTDLSNDAPDDGFHEIQLSGKQLVFLFMATTVVSVVIFLCGVLVGRSVKSGTLTAEATSVSTGGPGSTPPPLAPVAEAPASATPPTTSYSEQLTAAKPSDQPLRPRSESPEPPAPAPAPAESPTPAAPAETAKAEKPPAPIPPPQGTTGTAKPGVWAVQVVALTDQAAANAVVKRLNSKGYPAFLVTPAADSAVQNYKVQVGRFGERSEAERIASRLQKEEQFKPWILR
jgi:cell division septation protein DedD